MFLKPVLLKTVHIKTVFAFPEASAAETDMIKSVIAVLNVPKVEKMKRRSWSSAGSADIEPLALRDISNKEALAQNALCLDVVDSMQGKFHALYDLVGEDRNECKGRLMLENNFRCLLGIGCFFLSLGSYRLSGWHSSCL